MKTMLIYTEDFVPAEINEETGEEVVPSHYEKTFTPYDLSNVVKVKLTWSGVEVMTADGAITKHEHVEEIYYR